MLAVFAAGRRRRLRVMRMWEWMLLFLLATGQSQVGVRRLGAVFAGEVPIAALAPLVRFVAHKAPGKLRKNIITSSKQVTLHLKIIFA